MVNFGRLSWYWHGWLTKGTVILTRKAFFDAREHRGPLSLEYGVLGVVDSGLTRVFESLRVDCRLVLHIPFDERIDNCRDIRLPALVHGTLAMQKRER